MRNTLFSSLLLFLLLAGLAAAALAQPPSLPEPGALAAESARHYREEARYPRWSRVLPAGLPDPVRVERTPTEIVTGGRDGAPLLTVWGDQVSYEFPNPVGFYATVDGGEVVAITGEIVNEAGDTVGTLSFFDDSADFGKSGDGVFTARGAWTKSLKPPVLADNYLVKIQATFADGTSQHATAGFLYSRPHARLTGRFRDRIDGDNNLIVRSQVEVEEAGRFHLSGVLHTIAGEPVGTAQMAVELEPGKHWIDLTFFGLMFHDRRVAGPFRLGSLALSTTGAMPNALNDLVLNAHTTRAVPLKSLRAKPFNDPGLLEAAATLEAEAARSRRPIR